MSTPVVLFVSLLLFMIVGVPVAWHAQLFIPEGLISSLYGCEFSVKEGKIRGNFYKCADDSPTPHYGALFPVDSVSLGFHNPERFGTIKIIKR